MTTRILKTMYNSDADDDYEINGYRAIDTGPDGTVIILSSIWIDRSNPEASLIEILTPEFEIISRQIYPEMLNNLAINQYGDIFCVGTVKSKIKTKSYDAAIFKIDRDLNICTEVRDVGCVDATCTYYTSIVIDDVAEKIIVVGGERVPDGEDYNSLVDITIYSFDLVELASLCGGLDDVITSVNTLALKSNGNLILAGALVYEDQSVGALVEFDSRLTIVNHTNIIDPDNIDDESEIKDIIINSDDSITAVGISLLNEKLVGFIAKFSPEFLIGKLKLFRPSGNIANTLLGCVSIPNGNILAFGMTYRANSNTHITNNEFLVTYNQDLDVVSSIQSMLLGGTLDLFNFSKFAFVKMLCNPDAHYIFMIIKDEAALKSFKFNQDFTALDYTVEQF